MNSTIEHVDTVCLLTDSQHGSHPSFIGDAKQTTFTSNAYLDTKVCYPYMLKIYIVYLVQSQSPATKLQVLSARWGMSN